MSIIGRSFGRALAEVWPVIVGVVAGYVVGLFAIAAIIHGIGTLFGVFSFQSAVNWGVTIGVVIGVVFFAGWRARAVRGKWSREFERMFEFKPPSHRREILLLQYAVEDTLRRRAGYMEESFNVENKIRFNPRGWAQEVGVDLSTPGGLDEARENLAGAATASASRKRFFWRTHRLARTFGFAVKPKYGDYLNLR